MRYTYRVEADDLVVRDDLQIVHARVFAPMLAQQL
jgi:hypothetical protein